MCKQQCTVLLKSLGVGRGPVAVLLRFDKMRSMAWGVV